MLTANELLAGNALSFTVQVPPHLLGSEEGNPAPSESSVRLRPLTVRDLQLISRAARENDQLSSVLMVQASLLEPEVTLAEVNKMPVGLMQFLLDEVNRISGISTGEEELEMFSEDPLARAAFLMAQEFGWTPEQVSELTLGQVMLNLQLLKEKMSAHG